MCIRDREYSEHLLARITIILSGLYAATEAWSDRSIPRIYNEGVQQAQRGVNTQYKAAGKKPPDIGKSTSADFDAVSILQRNLNADLTTAVDHVGRMMEDEIRQAGLQASLKKVSSGQTVKQMQRNLCLLYTSCIAGNTIDRKIQSGGNGIGAQEDISYTLNTADRHAVCFGFQAFGKYKQTETGKSILASDDITTGDFIVDVRNLREKKGISGTLQAKENGGY